MRKLIVSMNVTLDGFMAGPYCELDWHFERWSSEMAESLSQELGRADTIILGRVTYNAMAEFWPTRSDCFSIPREDIAFADMMNNYTKVVFSKTIQQTHWKNSRVATGHLKSEIEKMKSENGKDMILYGSGKLVAALLKENLIDEYRLWIHPVLLGRGKTFFNEVGNTHELLLIDKRTFPSGVVKLRYITREYHKSTNQSTIQLINHSTNQPFN
jgi:dihydrofolate reductase